MNATAKKHKHSPTTTLALETRVSDRKRELIAELLEHKKNSCRSGAADAVGVLTDRLKALEQIVKLDIVKGWANIAPEAERRFNDWIAR